jgi:hypothetical protein
MKNINVEVEENPSELGSYRKMLPTIKSYPNSAIVVADDDLYYPRNWLKTLVRNYSNSGGTILGHRGHLIKFNPNLQPLPYDSWERNLRSPRVGYDVLLTSGAGILFPPKSLPKCSTDFDIIKELAPTSDDIWFWRMIILGGFRSQKIGAKRYLYGWRLENKSSLCTENVDNKANDIAIKKVLEKYPLKDFDHGHVTQSPEVSTSLGPRKRLG